MGFLFGGENNSQVRKLKKIGDKVIALEEKYKNLTDEELKNQTQILKDRLAKGETLDQILPDAFAVCREASARVLNMRHFYVQILGGIALHQGRIAEMATGEGKTLVATLPAYLNALTGKGVHVVTVNEYLAKRDAEWMGKVYKFLGLKVGVIVSEMQEDIKRNAYLADICYCTNNELGFDYLRDNMAITPQQRMQRELNFAIVDEVDSILIDEARTPLIISGRGQKSGEAYVSANMFAKTLKLDEDFEIDVKTKQIILKEEGISKAEKYFNIENLSDVEHIELNHFINNALKANFIMFKDENYIVKKGEVIIVDEFTGRLMPGRRFNDGLHQAIEAKENVEIKDENKTLATITFQNFFRLYAKLSGMTGTAKTEEGEFRTIYNLDVVTIPTNKPKKRIDESDIIYTTYKGKVNAIIDEIKRCNEVGRPVLVGTVTIEKSEELSKALKQAKIKHTVLNAKNHEQESAIVAQAGRTGMVTIATNMAGRGTDILLGGNPEFMAKKRMKDEKYTDDQISYATAFYNSQDEEMQKARARYTELYNEYKSETDKEKEQVVNLGGLHIIGTERHESRRIDNQLRGRAARQGDPGSSVFFLSLEDDLMKRFGGEKMQRVAQVFKIDETTPIQLKMMSRMVESAQKKIEAQNFGARKTVLQFDDVLNKQREIIYAQRNQVLEGLSVHDQIVAMYPPLLKAIVEKHLSDDKPYYEWDLSTINEDLEKGLFEKGSNFVDEKFVEDCDVAEVEEKLLKRLDTRYALRMEEAKENGIDFEKVERMVLLKVVDANWMNHIDDMQTLKNEIFSRGFGNQDPVLAYKIDGLEMFENMIAKIRETTVLVLLNSTIQVKQPETVQKPTFTPVAHKDVFKAHEEKKLQAKKEKPFVQKTVVNEDKKVGRNDPCPCGSGKKYKNCCGVNE